MRRRGFSILELLVSIGIIAVLLHIASTVSFYAKRHARKLQCQSNVREITTAMTSYDTENYSFPWSFNDSAEALSTSGVLFVGNLCYDRCGLWWFDYLYDDHTKENSILWCPERDLDNMIYRNNVLVGNYGVNQSVCKMYRAFPPKFRDFTGAPLSAEDIRQPSKCLLVIDSGYAMINWWHVADQPPESLDIIEREEAAAYLPGLRSNARRPIWPGLEKDALQGRHINGKINAAFVDGHVESTSPEDFAVTRQESGYKNVSHTWEPR